MALFPPKRFVWDEPIEWTRLRRKDIWTLHRSKRLHVGSLVFAAFLATLLLAPRLWRDDRIIGVVPALSASIFSAYLFVMTFATLGLCCRLRVQVWDDGFTLMTAPYPDAIRFRDVEYIEIWSYRSFYLMKIVLKSKNCSYLAIPPNVDILALILFLNEKGLLRL